MRASVSEIVMFRKCPRMWAWARKWVKPPSEYMLRGTKIHKEVENLLLGNAIENPMLDPSLHNIILKELSHYKVRCVETPFEYDFKGHTILGRPDATLEHMLTGYGANFQIKTSSRNMASHSLYVQSHPHEVVYAHAMSHFLGAPFDKVLLLRVIIPPVSPVKVDFTEVMLPNASRRQEVMDSVHQTLDEMEKYAQKEIQEIPIYTDNCVSWNAGTVCGYLNPCLKTRAASKLDDADFAHLYGLEPAQERYPELDAMYSNNARRSGKASPGTSGANP